MWQPERTVDLRALIRSTTEGLVAEEVVELEVCMASYAAYHWVWRESRWNRTRSSSGRRRRARRASGAVAVVAVA